MDDPANTVIDRVKVREVAGVFMARGLLDEAINALLLAGFDRADVDLMAGADTIRRKLGEVYAPPEELADATAVPRRAFVAREEATEIMAGIAGLLTFIGATAAALGVVASGGALAVAAAAAAAGGAVTGGIGVVIARSIGLKQARELEFAAGCRRHRSLGARAVAGAREKGAGDPARQRRACRARA